MNRTIFVAAMAAAVVMVLIPEYAQAITGTSGGVGGAGQAGGVGQNGGTCTTPNCNMNGASANGANGQDANGQSVIVIHHRHW